MKDVLALALILLCISSIVSAATIHVPADQPTIQTGIDAAVDGDTVLVADGVYIGEGNRGIDFLGKAITVESENGRDHCIIDMGQFDRGFSFVSGEGRDSVLRGFAIQNGRAIGGGGIFIEQTSPTIEENRIMGNTATSQYGGGIYCVSGSPLIRDNLITLNLSMSQGSNGHGGGICCRYDSTPVITGNQFSDNHSENAGGGLATFQSTNARITHNVFNDNFADSGGGGVAIDAGLVAYNTIVDNEANSWGGGIMASGQSSSRIIGNTISGNKVNDWCGAGICVYSHHSAEISGNLISNNLSESYYGGGGIALEIEAFAEIRNNLIIGNESWDAGGGIAIRGHSRAVITGCTIVENVALGPGFGGGLHVVDNFDVQTQTINDSIFWGNVAGYGPEIYLADEARVELSFCDVDGGWPGLGNIDADPMFVSGVAGDYCLSQIACGDGTDSPCLDVGDPDTTPYGTTGCLFDSGIVDLGFHYPMNWVAAGPGPAADNPTLVRVFNAEPNAAPLHEFSAYGVQRYGVRVGRGDLDGDGADEMLTGPGPGTIFGPHVRGFEPNGTPLPGLNFLAYGTHKFGVNVAAGDIDGDGHDEIITGAGPGAVFGPHVRAFDYDGTPGVSPVPGVSFLAYGTPKWGVNVTAGDLDGDGIDEIVTGAGPGAVYGPHVRGWNVDGGGATAIPGVSFLAYGTPKFGVNVGCGDVDGDGYAEIITGPGPGPEFGAQVRGWDFDGGQVSPMPDIDYFVWAPYESLHGVQVFSGTDLDGDGRDELLVGHGPDPAAGTEVRVYRYHGSPVYGEDHWITLEAFGDWPLTHGTTVAAGQF